MAAVFVLRGGVALLSTFVRLAGAMGGGIGKAVTRPILTALDTGPKGFADIQDARVVRRAVIAAAEVVKEHAVANVPKRTGLLANSIQVVPGGVVKRLGISINKAGFTATVVTGTLAELQINNSEKGYYPASIEFGYRHGRGGNFIPARPYLRPALYDHETEILNIMKNDIRQGIFKVAKVA